MRHLIPATICAVVFSGCYSAHERPGGAEVWECQANTIVRRSCAREFGQAANAYCDEVQYSRAECLGLVECQISEWADVWPCDEGQIVVMPRDATGSSDSPR